MFFNFANSKLDTHAFIIYNPFVCCCSENNLRRKLLWNFFFLRMREFFMNLVFTEEVYVIKKICCRIGLCNFHFFYDVYYSTVSYSRNSIFHGHMKWKTRVPCYVALTVIICRVHLLWSYNSHPMVNKKVLE